jgi:hypothetical protein
MYGQLLFDHWTPPGSIWTPWAKPALFAQLSPPMTAAPDPPLTAPTDWAPAAAQSCALIIDLPAHEPLLLGIALAAKGYQPVPLYNTCTGPYPTLDLTDVVATLDAGHHVLQNIELPHDAPPAFLIDSRRRKGHRPPSPGAYDNRWLVLPQDFPSATFLHTHGIRQALLVQESAGQPQEDLAHVLLRWQEGGIKISVLPWRPPGQAPVDTTITRPSHFRAAWYSFLALLHFRPNSAGGFGSVVPTPSQG